MPAQEATGYVVGDDLAFTIESAYSQAETALVQLLEEAISSGRLADAGYYRWTGLLRPSSSGRPRRPGHRRLHAAFGGASDLAGLHRGACARASADRQFGDPPAGGRHRAAAGASGGREADHDKDETASEENRKIDMKEQKMTKINKTVYRRKA